MLRRYAFLVTVSKYFLLTYHILPTEPHTSSALQTQTLDRKKVVGSAKCLATVHGPSRGRGRGTIQRPRGVVIEQLIAEECGELAHNRSQEDLEDSEDPDDL
jgi:hypothetical protein